MAITNCSPGVDVPLSGGHAQYDGGADPGASDYGVLHISWPCGAPRSSRPPPRPPSMPRTLLRRPRRRCAPARGMGTAQAASPHRLACRGKISMTVCSGRKVLEGELQGLEHQLGQANQTQATEQQVAQVLAQWDAERMRILSFDQDLGQAANQASQAAEQSEAAKAALARMTTDLFQLEQMLGRPCAKAGSATGRPTGDPLQGQARRQSPAIVRGMHQCRRGVRSRPPLPEPVRSPAAARQVVRRMADLQDREPKGPSEKKAVPISVSVCPDGVYSYYHLQHAIGGLPLDYGYGLRIQCGTGCWTFPMSRALRPQPWMASGQMPLLVPCSGGWCCPSRGLPTTGLGGGLPGVPGSPGGGTGQGPGGGGGQPNGVLARAKRKEPFLGEARDREYAAGERGRAEAMAAGPGGRGYGDGSPGGRPANQDRRSRVGAVSEAVAALAVVEMASWPFRAERGCPAGRPPTRNRLGWSDCMGLPGTGLPGGYPGVAGNGGSPGTGEPVDM